MAAARSIAGPLDIKMLTSYSDLGKTKISGPQTVSMSRRHELARRASMSYGRKESTYFAHTARQPWKLTKAKATVLGCISSQTQSQPANASGEDKSTSKAGTTIPSSAVESLVTDICDTTSISEFKLNLGSFGLSVKRDLNGVDSAAQPGIASPDNVEKSNQFSSTNGSATSTSLVVSNPKPSSDGVQGFLDDASNDGLVLLQSPIVGRFRLSRTRKGRILPPVCVEKKKMKQGQVFCFIERLGVEIPIETDVPGEVVKILKKEGEPVGYGDALLALLPLSPGMKKLLPA